MVLREFFNFYSFSDILIQKLCHFLFEFAAMLPGLKPCDAVICSPI